MSERKWGHLVRFTKSRGNWQASCSCGWHSERSTDEEAVKQAARVHSGLVEKAGR